MNVCMRDDLITNGLNADMIESNEWDSSHVISDNVLEPINAQFKEARERKHLSQETFSQKIGISNVQLSRIEQSKCRPSISTIYKAAPYIGKDLETLLISASYSGEINSPTPIYLDLDGKTFDLQSTAKQMYAIDGELFSLLKDFFVTNYQQEDAESLKTMIKIFNMNMELKGNTMHFSLFSQLYKSLKDLLLSISIFIDSFLKRESIQDK